MTIKPMHETADFEPGELNRLIAEGDESIRKEGTIDIDEAFAELREQRSKTTRQRTSRQGKAATELRKQQ